MLVPRSYSRFTAQLQRTLLFRLRSAKKIFPSIRTVTTFAQAPERYRKPPQEPPRFNATPESLFSDTKRLISQSRAIRNDIVASVTPENATFENVVLPMAQTDNTIGLETSLIGFYQGVSTNKALRDASTEADKQFTEYGVEASMREDIFQLIQAALDKAAPLDPESQRLLEKLHRAYIQNGLHIPKGPKRDRFREVKKQLSELMIVFQKTLMEENGGVWFTQDELHGVPGSVISNLEKGASGTEHEGKVRATFKYPDIFPILKYATNAATRKKIFVANENRCNSNVPLFKEITLLRDEGARLLGYKNYATMRIEDKLMKTPENVDGFLSNIYRKLSPGGLKEIETLLKMKKHHIKSQNEVYDGRYYLWDHRFYDRLMVERDFSVDQNKIAEYFPLQTTIAGMLRIFEELFGLVFIDMTEEARSKDISWHEDVSVFSVWDDGGEEGRFVGYLYLDLFPREGKYPHACNATIQPGFMQNPSTRRYPATALICNFTKPTLETPCLLKHDELVIMFHELGHAIHNLVSRTTYSHFHGIRTVRDFVEAPSQMLEYWCWDPRQLKGLSRHYSSLSPELEVAWRESLSEAEQQQADKPEERIPDVLVERLISTRRVNSALFNLRQLHFGMFDMEVHSPASHEDIKALDITELFNRLRKDISKLDGLEVEGEGWHWGHGQATFGHMVSGYDAGYYGYLSSQVYSADMWYSVFARDPMNRKEGRRYRYTVLEKGGSVEEMRLLKNFLGREPNPDAFYRELVKI